MSLTSSCSIDRLAHVSQILAGRALAWVEPPDAAALGDTFADITPPALELHAIAMERMLITTASRLAATIDRNFRRRFFVVGQAVVEPPLIPVRDAARRLLVRDSVENWASDYRRQFRTAHDSAAHRARRVIEEALGQAPGAGEIARAIAVGRRTLERQFRQEIGVSIREYRTTQRVVEAVHRLHSSAECIEAIALGTGWRSKKGLYDALSETLGITPGTIRQMSASDVDLLIARLRALGSPHTLAA